MGPLRPYLYERLRAVFKHVAVSNAGEAMNYSFNAVLEPTTGSAPLQIHHSGEYYRVNCPFCSDTRKRLWVSHMWNYPFEHNGKKSWANWLCYCYNEKCTQDYSKRRRLVDMVFSESSFSYGVGKNEVQQGEVFTGELTETTYPGTVVELSSLSQLHPAITYLRGRGYDPAVIGKHFGVRYCVQPPPRYPGLEGRFIVPVIQNGVMVGWQARLVGESANKNIPKYFTMPGMPKRKILYNFDATRGRDFVVICEGPTDVWSFGSEAVAMLGKSISSEQQHLLLTSHSDDAIFVVLLDSDATDEAQALVDALKHGYHRKVAMIQLAAGTDPGDYTQDEIRGIVFDVIEKERNNVVGNCSRPCSV